MSYTVSKKGSKSVVKFSCPTCAAPLESPLEEAGKRFPCPNCGKTFVTPGAEELKKLRAKQAEDEAREAAEAITRPAVSVAESVAVKEPAPVEYQTAPQDESLAALAAAASAPTYRGTVEIPDYTRIRAGSYVLWVLSLLMYVVAGFFAVLMVINLIAIARANVRQSGSHDPMELAIVGLYLVAMTSYVIGGALLGLLSSLSLAVRDMARNSFRR